MKPPTDHQLLLDGWPCADGWVLALEGELDLATVPDLTARLCELHDDQPERIVLDLRALSFMDSTGLAAIIDANLHSRRDGRRLELICDGGQAGRLLQLTGVDRQLTLCQPLDL